MIRTPFCGKADCVAPPQQQRPQPSLMAGAVVTHKNGQRMTVEGDDGKRVGCAWFDPFGALHRAQFQRGELQAA